MFQQINIQNEDPETKHTSFDSGRNMFLSTFIIKKSLFN